MALLVFFAGQMLVRRVAVLQRFCLPPPVVGGCLIAVMLAMSDDFAHMRVSFDMSLKDSLLIAFFTTVGLAADARMLVKGGSKLAIFLLVCSVFERSIQAKTLVSFLLLQATTTIFSRIFRKTWLLVLLFLAVTVSLVRAQDVINQEEPIPSSVDEVILPMDRSFIEKAPRPGFFPWLKEELKDTSESEHSVKRKGEKCYE